MKERMFVGASANNGTLSYRRDEIEQRMERIHNEKVLNEKNYKIY